MSNQTLFVVFILVAAGLVSAFVFRKRVLSEKEKNAELSNRLKTSEEKNAQLKLGQTHQMYVRK